MIRNSSNKNKRETIYLTSLYTQPSFTTFNFCHNYFSKKEKSQTKTLLNCISLSPITFPEVFFFILNFVYNMFINIYVLLFIAYKNPPLYNKVEIFHGVLSVWFGISGDIIPYRSMRRTINFCNSCQVSWKLSRDQEQKRKVLFAVWSP